MHRAHKKSELFSNSYRRAVKIVGPKGVSKSLSLFLLVMELTQEYSTNENTQILYFTDMSISNSSMMEKYLNELHCELSEVVDKRFVVCLDVGRHKADQLIEMFMPLVHSHQHHISMIVALSSGERYNSEHKDF